MDPSSKSNPSKGNTQSAFGRIFSPINKRFKTIPLFVWGIILAVLLVGSCSYFRVLSSFELLTYDWRFRQRPPQTVSSDIVVIEIDDATLEALGTWPLPRDFHASLIDVLKEFGTKAIVFDLLFSEPTPWDSAFAESIQRAQNVYLPLAMSIPLNAWSKELTDNAHGISVNINPVLKSQAKAIGHINFNVGYDGKARMVPLFIREKENFVPQISLLAACQWLGLNPHHVDVKPNRIIVDQTLSIPVVNHSLLLVNYPGNWNQSFKRVSYVDILRSYKAKLEGTTAPFDLNALRGKICFVGLTATGTEDFGPTPLEGNVPMVHVHPSIFNSVIQQRFIADAGRLFNTFINLLVLTAGIWFSFRSTFLRSLGLTIFLSGLYTFVAFTLFFVQGIWIDLVLPIGILLICFVGGVVYRFFQEIRKRELIEKELEIARSIQQSFLPSKIKPIQGLSIATFFKPAKFVAGDLYDIVKIDDNRMGILIGDVAGKGASASLVMAQAISIFRMLARQYTEGKELLGALNNELAGKISGRFVTALYLVVDVPNKKVTVASAGHGPVVVYREKLKKIEDIPLKGNVPLGLMGKMTYDSVEFFLEPQDRVVIFSDGINEARNPKQEEFGLERVNKIYVEYASSSLEKMIEDMAHVLVQFSGHEQYDDMTLIGFLLN
jgi:CHASE2 domain-containing sensor protein